MNDRNHTKQLETGVAVLVCLLVAGVVFFYIFGTPYEEWQEDTQTEESTEPRANASMRFKDDSYVLMVKCQKDMSEYLELHNVAREEVDWFSSDTENVDVGSSGHVAIQDYEVQTTLTAKSRWNDKVVATCQIRTLKRADDFQNQMAEYNGAGIDNSVAKDGEVVVSSHSGQGMIDLQQVSYTPAPKKEDSGQGVLDDVYEGIENNDMPVQDSDGKQYVERKQFVDAGDSQPKDYLVYHESDKKSVSKVMAYDSVQDFSEGKESGPVTVYYYTDERKLSLVVSYEKYEDVVKEVVSGEEYPLAECVRYYFSGDVMIKWEDVSQDGVTYTLEDYQNGTEELKKQYDNTEKKILNEGYIILQKVEEDVGVQVVSGEIENPSQSAVEIVLHSDELDCDVYKGMTKKDGSYQICVPKMAGEYTLHYKSKDGEDNIVKSMKSKKISITDSFEFVRQRMQNGGFYE